MLDEGCDLLLLVHIFLSRLETDLKQVLLGYVIGVRIVKQEVIDLSEEHFRFQESRRQ
jgi:hypothetical protein